jgi:hypothetical protein
MIGEDDLRHRVQRLRRRGHRVAPSGVDLVDLVDDHHVGKLDLLGQQGRQRAVVAVACGLATLFLQVFAQSAANAAIAHLHQLLVGARQRSASVLGAAVDERGVDADLAHLVDDDGHTQALAVGQQVVKQRGLAGAKEA